MIFIPLNLLIAESDMAKSKQYSVFMRNILLSRRLCFDSFPNSGTNFPLPLKSPDVTIWGGSQTTSGEIANKTGLLCSVDDFPLMLKSRG